MCLFPGSPHSASRNDAAAAPYSCSAGAKTAIALGRTENSAGVSVVTSPSVLTGIGLRRLDPRGRPAEEGDVVALDQRPVAEPRRERDQFGDRRRLDRVDVEEAVVDLRLRADRQTAAEVDAVADRDLVGADRLRPLAAGNRRLEALRLVQRARRGDDIAEDAPLLLEVLVLLLGDLHREADARDVEEMCVVDLADVDPPRRALGDDAAAATGSAGMPRVRARSLAVPKGRMPTGFPASISAGMAPLTVPSPPATTIASTPPTQSRMTPRERSPVGALADVEVEAVPGETGDGAAYRRLGARCVEIDDDEKPALRHAGVSSGEAAVAVLELLARAAGAGRVALDLAPGRGIVGVDLGARRRARSAPAGRRPPASGSLISFSPVSGSIWVSSSVARSSSGTSGGGALDDLDPHQLRRHRLAEAAEHRLEQLEGLGLVLVERIALGVAAEADHLAEMVERDQMLAPEMVERLQQHRLLDLAHDVRARSAPRAAPRLPRRRP